MATLQAKRSKSQHEIPVLKNDIQVLPPPPEIPQQGPQNGLDVLTPIEFLMVMQDVELMEILCGCESENRYRVLNSRGHTMFNARESSDCCSRICCGSIRVFELGVFNMFEEQIIRLSRPFRCTGCLFPCCLQKMDIFSPPNVKIGSIKEHWACCNPKFTIKNAANVPLFKIKSPCCHCFRCCNVEFKIFTMVGNVELEIGKISKKWSGFLKEAFTDADNFGINFPLELSNESKALLISACFLIDFIFYQKKNSCGL